MMGFYNRSGKHYRAAEVVLPKASEPSETTASKLKAKLRPLVAGWMRRGSRYRGDECFLPCPKITFLVDEPIALACQLCQDSHLKLQPE